MGVRMKITLTEWDGCFGFEMEAETLADAALLTRFALNATNEIRSLDTLAHQAGQFTGSLVLGKHKHADGYVQKRR